MRREAGFTLYELLVVTAMVVVTSGTMAGVAWTMHRTERHTAAYVADIHGLRRAVRVLDEDLRGAAHVEGHVVDGVRYRLEEGCLLRGERVLARNIAAFSMARAARSSSWARPSSIPLRRTSR